MKRITFITIITATIFSSCVKQKDCEGCEEGVLINMEKPYKIINNAGNKVTVYAHFIPESHYTGGIIEITKKIPKKYREKDTLYICARYGSDAGRIPEENHSEHIAGIFICIEETKNK